MSEWINAEEYCVSVFDGTHDTPKVAETGYKLVTSKNILSNTLDLNSAYFISEEDFVNINKRSKVKQYDILFSMIGTVGSLYFETSDTIDYAIKNIGVFSSGDKEKAEWLYYYLQSSYAQQYIKRYLNGAVQKFLPLKGLREFPVPQFNKELHNRIKILLNIDKKIQINNQINQELEAMAKTLYDYWFVQFDFPDQNGNPYKSSGGKMIYHPELKREIPEGWGVEKLSSILEIGRETINPMKTPKEEFKYYSIPEYDVSGSFSYELGETIKSNKFLVEKSDLLVSKLNPWFNRVVYNLEESAISSTEFIVWKTINRFEKNFLYQVATSEGFIEYCTRFATGTSNSHKRVSPDIMVSFQIPFEKTYIQKFGEITDSIRTQVLQNNEQNQELIQLRDWLLPMLMNGQVKVE